MRFGNWVLGALLPLMAACQSAGETQRPGLSSPVAAIDSRAGLVEIAGALREGGISSEELVAAYVRRIESYDRAGPELGSVIALNPAALTEARERDAEARRGLYRGPLHGIPVLVKDNIETRELPTTAGSLALRGNATGRDAPIVARLRAAGAIILGKTNLSEWANFRSDQGIAGWSGVGGHTRNPYDPAISPCGSSSGSAVAVAAGFAPAAIGTETNGSIVCPAAANHLVGLKPTVGLLPRTYIIPISTSFDTAGPIARDVRSVALMLDIMAGPDSSDPATAAAEGQVDSYLSSLDGDIAGIRIGVFRWAEGRDEQVSERFEARLGALEAAGAELVEITEFSPSPAIWSGAEPLLQYEFKSALDAYLADVAPGVDITSLADLIAFNERHASEELALFDQSKLIAAQQTGGTADPAYTETRRAVLEGTRQQGIDRLLSENAVVALVMPSGPPPRFIDPDRNPEPSGPPIGAGWLPAFAGYPVLTLPMGDDPAVPLGFSITGAAFSESMLLNVASALEQAFAPPPVPDLDRLPPPAR